MKFFYLIACLSLTSTCLGSEEKPLLKRKVSLSLDGKYLKIPAPIKELLTAQTIDETGLHELTSFLSENNGEPSSIEAVDTNGTSLLVHAAESKHEQARLIIYSFKPDFNRLCKGRSALFHAVASSNPESVQVMTELINLNADIKTTWGEMTLENQINDVLKAKRAILESFKHSLNEDIETIAENKEAMRVKKIFIQKKNLLAQAQLKLQGQVAQASATK